MKDQQGRNAIVEDGLVQILVDLGYELDSDKFWIVPDNYVVTPAENCIVAALATLGYGGITRASEQPNRSYVSGTDKA